MKNPANRYIKIRGERWRLKFVKRMPKRGTVGLCVYTNRTIYIKLNSGEMIGSIVHEIMHAALQDIEEDAVSETEDAITAGLGYLIPFLKPSKTCKCALS